MYCAPGSDLHVARVFSSVVWPVCASKVLKQTCYAEGEEKVFYGHQEDYLRALALMPCERISHGQLAAYYKAIIWLEKSVPPNKPASFYRTPQCSQ